MYSSRRTQGRLRIYWAITMEPVADPTDLTDKIVCWMSEDKLELREGPLRLLGEYKFTGAEFVYLKFHPYSKAVHKGILEVHTARTLKFKHAFDELYATKGQASSRVRFVDPRLVQYLHPVVKR